ncbi:hypothetical protein ACQP0C_27705 [Nocardia sp. CA-129566]|uniref:hypothetical protein n=1 Tax=Nocardia sp. CA-129566 TaxID=3239976 RepID=UPI003D95B377
MTLRSGVHRGWPWDGLVCATGGNRLLKPDSDGSDAGGEQPPFQGFKEMSAHNNAD